jgi:very-short-patch-repair endonuclease
MDAPAKTRARAKKFRRDLTYTEARLWTRIRRGALGGLHFRRQHPFGRFVLDFYCDQVRLAVEVDGGIHQLEARQIDDALRDIWLAEHRIRVLRIPSKWVTDCPDRVDALILAEAAKPFERPKVRTVSPQ